MRLIRVKNIFDKFMRLIIIQIMHINIDGLLNMLSFANLKLNLS